MSLKTYFCYFELHHGSMKAHEHVSMQDTLARDPLSNRGTLARKHERQIDTWACKARNLADSLHKYWLK